MAVIDHHAWVKGEGRWAKTLVHAGTCCICGKRVYSWEKYPRHCNDHLPNE